MSGAKLLDSGAKLPCSGAKLLDSKAKLICSGERLMDFEAKLFCSVAKLLFSEPNLIFVWGQAALLVLDNVVFFLRQCVFLSGGQVTGKHSF